MKSTFSIIFYLKRQVVKKDGTVPVMGRITVDGTQAQFSCKTTANPDLWDTKGGRMIGKSMQALEVNRKLDKMRVSFSKHYQEIMDRDNFVTADKVKNAFLGLEYRCHTLMKVYFQSRDEMEKQYKAGIKSLSSFTRYRIGCAYVGEFLQSHYHVKDIALKELSLPFITDYETFLRTEKHLKINSAMVFVRNLRAMVFRAIDNEWLVKDPFRRYEYKEEETTREFLTKEEIRLLMEIPITRKKMSMVRDLFLFCCFTGLAFIDLYNLKEENIKTFFDDGEWIIIHRQKTGTEADIKLLDYPKQIMEKYRGLCEDGRVGKQLQRMAKGERTDGKYKEIGAIYGFLIKVVSETSFESGLPFVNNRFVVEGHYKYQYNNGHIAKSDPIAAANNFVNALQKMQGYIEQYDSRCKTLEKEIPQLQEIASKTWKKENEIKGLKAELALLDRKIQLKLSPPTLVIDKKGKSHEVKEYNTSENDHTESTVAQNRMFRVGL